MSDLRDDLLTALQAEPKPIDGRRVLEIARATLPPTEFEQFNKWTKANGPTLLEMLNGSI